jgi:hypothetical protein
METVKRYLLITCEVLFREVCLCASQSKNIIDINFMPKGLHDIGKCEMSKKLQTEIDNVDKTKYDAILLGYGLCNNGIQGLHSKLPLILPKAHDCITLLLGSRKRYDKYFHENPGTFYKSSGWIERDINPNENEQSVTSQLGMNNTYEEYVEKYGEENAEFLMEMLGDWCKNYSKVTYINTQTGNPIDYRVLVKQQATENQWEYEEIEGDTNLIFRLLEGEWDNQDFLIVPPDNSIEPTNDENIIKYTPIELASKIDIAHNA